MTRKILVVANRTADSPDLIADLRGRAVQDRIDFTLLVPAVPHGLELEEAIIDDPEPERSAAWAGSCGAEGGAGVTLYSQKAPD